MIEGSRIIDFVAYKERKEALMATKIIELPAHGAGVLKLFMSEAARINKAFGWGSKVEVDELIGSVFSVQRSRKTHKVAELTVSVVTIDRMIDLVKNAKHAATTEEALRDFSMERLFACRMLGLIAEQFTSVGGSLDNESLGKIEALKVRTNLSM